MRLGIAAAVSALVADQASKYVVVEHLMRPEGVVETPFFTDRIIAVLPVFNIRLTWNTGISFSLFAGGEGSTLTALVAIQIVITMGLLWYMVRAETPLLQAACGLIAGGALGNIIDRLMIGAVVDFLDFHWGDWHPFIFNLADTAISVGVGLWLLDAVRSPSHHAGGKV